MAHQTRESSQIKHNDVENSKLLQLLQQRAEQLESAITMTESKLEETEKQKEIQGTRVRLC